MSIGRAQILISFALLCGSISKIDRHSELSFGYADKMQFRVGIASIRKRYIYTKHVLSELGYWRESYSRRIYGRDSERHRRIVACKWYDKWWGWRFCKRSVSHENYIVQFSYMYKRGKNALVKKIKTQKSLC